MTQQPIWRAEQVPTGVVPMNPKRALIYCRVSSPGQKENGSLEEQEARCRVWCAEHGYEVFAVYHEVYSGEDVDRPQLEALMAEVKAGRADAIVADKVDRFSRADPAITAYVMVEAEQYGATVEFVEVQDDSFEGQILRAVLSIVARVEHKRIKERVNAGKRRRVLGDPQKGRPARLLPGNVPKYGWRYKDGDKSAYILEPHQARIMERIYGELGDDGRSLNAICRDLEIEGELPPTAALAAAGYDIGARKVSLHWHPSSIARRLKESCYWGEAVAYRYEAYEGNRRDPRTNRVRKKKRTRYRDPASDLIVRYPPEVWPPIVSKELALRAIARLRQNQVEAERNLKHTGISFLRAGLALCGYCGDHLILHAHQEAKGAPVVLRFICGRHRAYLGRRPSAVPCPAVTQFSVRVQQMEDAVWAFIVDALRDPRRVPEAYERLTAREAEVRAQQGERIERLARLITQATERRDEYMRAVGMTRDGEMKAGYMRLAEEQNAQIRTWQVELERAEGELDRELAETEAVRSAITEINSQTVRLLRMDTTERRRLAQLLGVRVIAYRDTHEPWFVLVSDLPGVIAAWRARRHRHAPVEPVRLSDEETARLLEFWQDDDPGHVVYRDAVSKWTAPVGPRATEREELPVARAEPAGVGS